MKHKRKKYSVWMTGVVFLTLVQFVYLQAYCRTHCDFMPEGHDCPETVEASEPPVFETPVHPEEFAPGDLEPVWINMGSLHDLRSTVENFYTEQERRVTSHSPPLYLQFETFLL